VILGFRREVDENCAHDGDSLRNDPEGRSSKLTVASNSNFTK